MSADVINMQQRRTLASGRQNQDPNMVVGEREITPKKSCPKLERSIQEVLNHTRNTSGRGRQIVLDALHKKIAKKKTEKKTPTSASKTPQSGKKTPPSTKTSADQGAKRNPSDGIRAAEGTLSIADIKKRPSDQAESRVPLSDLNALLQSEKKYPDFTSSPVKSSQKDGVRVYTKRQKTEETPPALEPTSPNVTAEVFSPESFRRTSRMPLKADNSKPAAKRQLMTPSPTKNEICRHRDSCGFMSSVTTNFETNFEATTSTDLLSMDSETLETARQELGPEVQPLTFISKSPERLHGLMNLGNTCYMNVVIQILYSLPSFVLAMERLSDDFVKQEAEISKDLGSLSTLTTETVYVALLHVFRDLKRAGRYETVNPSVLKWAFAKQQSSFLGCIQQDAHEFFCSLIDQVQEDVSALLRKQFSNQADQPKLETVCPTTLNFSCSVRNSLTCSECGNVSSVEETYRDFSLALPEDERIERSKNCSLESLFNLYFQETTMSRKCENCGGNDAKAQATILKLPHILVLQLKRLHMDRDVPCTKIPAPVKFTPHLDIGPWCARDKKKFWSPTTTLESDSSDRVESGASVSGAQDQVVPGRMTAIDMDSGQGLASSFELESQDPSSSNLTAKNISTRYRLYGVVNHLGHHASGGHFTTDILDSKDERWLRCDDSHVMDVSADSVFNNVREAYMFFYVHEPINTETLNSQSLGQSVC